MLQPKARAANNARRNLPIVGLTTPDRASSLTRIAKKMTGKKLRSLELSELREKLWPEGGMYRDPNGSMVILWDECEAFVRITPDVFTTHENRVQLNMFASNHVASFSDPILWPEALDIIKSTGAPDDVVSCIALLTETHGFNSPSH